MKKVKNETFTEKKNQIVILFEKHITYIGFRNTKKNNNYKKTTCTIKKPLIFEILLIHISFKFDIKTTQTTNFKEIY